MADHIDKQIRDAATDGQIRVIRAFVVAVRQDGEPVASVTSAVANTITYDVQPVDTSLLIEQSALTGMTPYNRQYQNGRIRPMKISDYVEVVVFGAGTPNNGMLHLYHQGTERPDPHDCNGNRLEVT